MTNGLTALAFLARTERPKILRLSGMATCSGYYTADEWREKTGVDPRNFPGLITFSKWDACLWTARAEEICREWHAAGRMVNHQLTGR